MKEPITKSLIISTYNRPDALDLCLNSILKQTKLPDEVLIADDGSKEDTKRLVDEFAKMAPIPVHHIWHPDNGFQLSGIRNKAISRASKDYIIQIDGDLILHPNFIQDHISLAENGYFVTGSRILLSEKSTEKIIASRQIDFNIYVPGSSNIFNGLRNRVARNLFSKKYKIHGKHKFYVKGCNMAFWKKDLVLVNGYNEAFTGWGKEDSDIAIRLINAGLKKKFIKMGGIVYHLYHKEASRTNEKLNNNLMEMAIKNKTTFCEDGLNKYNRDKTEH